MVDLVLAVELGERLLAGNLCCVTMSRRVRCEAAKGDPRRAEALKALLEVLAGRGLSGVRTLTAAPSATVSTAASAPAARPSRGTSAPSPSARACRTASSETSPCTQPAASALPTAITPSSGKPTSGGP